MAQTAANLFNEMKSYRFSISILLLLGTFVVLFSTRAADKDAPSFDDQIQSLNIQLQEAAKTNKPVVITPLIGVGTVTFGTSLTEIEKDLGTPYRKSGTAYEYQHRGFALIGDREAKLAVIMAGGWCKGSDILTKVFKGKTKAGIGLDASQAEIVAAYGKPSKISEEEHAGDLRFVVMRYNKLGMQFALQNDQLVHLTLRARPYRSR